MAGLLNYFTGPLGPVLVILMLMIVIKFLPASQFQAETELYQIRRYNRNTMAPGGPQNLIPGARSCGGLGQLLQTSNEHCTTGQSSFPCVIPPHGGSNFEIVFIPTEDTHSILVQEKITLSSCKTCKGTTITTEKILPNVDLLAGEEYAFSRKLDGMTEELQEKTFSIRVEILREDDKKLEICSVVDFHVGKMEQIKNTIDTEF